MKILVAGMLAAGAAVAAFPPGAAAQAVKVQPGADDELRAVYATPMEIAEGARIAETSCARCHGANGVSASKGVPHLAGQRAAYLDLQLRAYRHSARVQGAMTGAVRYLSDDALVKVAA
jgi:cytochrome c553